MSRPTPGIAICLALCVGAGAAFGAVDQYGLAHELGDESQRVTIVDFAASWCAPCRRSLPLLEELAERHPGIRVVVVSVDDEVEGRDNLVSALDLELPVIWDEGHELAETFRPRGMPATFVLGPGGEVIYEHVGFTRRKWKELSELIARLDEAEEEIR